MMDEQQEMRERADLVRVWGGLLVIYPFHLIHDCGWRWLRRTMMSIARIIGKKELNMLENISEEERWLATQKSKCCGAGVHIIDEGSEYPEEMPGRHLVCNECGKRCEVIEQLLR